MRKEDVSAVIENLLKKDVFEYINIDEYSDSDIKKFEYKVGEPEGSEEPEEPEELKNLGAVSLDERISRVKRMRGR